MLLVQCAHFHRKAWDTCLITQAFCFPDDYSRPKQDSSICETLALEGASVFFTYSFYRCGKCGSNSIRTVGSSSQAHRLTVILVPVTECHRVDPTLVLCPQGLVESRTGLL
jgi:hypothetical protein